MRNNSVAIAPRSSLYMLTALFAFLAPTVPGQEAKPADSPGGVKTTEVTVPERDSYKDVPILVTIQQYGGRSIRVFPNEDASKSSGTNPKWYFAPVPIVSLQELKSSFAKLTDETKSDESRVGRVLALEFQLVFDNTELRGLIAEGLTAQRKATDQAAQSKVASGTVSYELVEFLPDEVVRMCWAKIGEKHQMIYVNPPQALIEQGVGHYISPEATAKVSVIGTSDELAAFVKDPRIILKCIAGSYKTEKNFVSVSLREYANSRFTQDLRGTDKMKNVISITTKSSGGGGGFSLGPVSFGAASIKTGSETVVDVHRWVTRKHLLDAATEYLSTVESDFWKEFGRNKAKDLNQVAEDMVNRVIQRAEKKTVTFQSIAERTLTYFDDQNRQLSVEVGKINGVALDSKAKLRLKTDKKEEGKAAIEGVPVEGKKEDHLELEIEGDAKATGLGTPIIPTTVDLYQASSAILDGITSETLREVQATRGKNIPIVDAFVRDDTPIGYDVGMIIASMIPYDLHSEEFVSNWRPCDGREVTGTKYAEARIRALGQSEGWVVPEIAEVATPDKKGVLQPRVPKRVEREGDVVRVPDLRGQFVRGLNRFVDSMPDQSSGLRSDGKQAPLAPKDPAKPDGDKVPERKEGEWQEDDFEKHIHGPIRAARPGGGDWNYFQEWKGKGRRQGHGVVHFDVAGDPTGGLETRPSNVSMYYYIKVQ